MNNVDHSNSTAKIWFSVQLIICWFISVLFADALLLVRILESNLVDSSEIGLLDLRLLFPSFLILISSTILVMWLTAMVTISLLHRLPEIYAVAIGFLSLLILGNGMIYLLPKLMI